MSMRTEPVSSQDGIFSCQKRISASTGCEYLHNLTEIFTISYIQRGWIKLNPAVYFNTCTGHLCYMAFICRWMSAIHSTHFKYRVLQTRQTGCEENDVVWLTSLEHNHQLAISRSYFVSRSLSLLPLYLGETYELTDTSNRRNLDTTFQWRSWR